ncbi:hypothetical protein M378DRAFT_625269 [Amanita muscaria Koide BX008]|uniref:Uncharacterized protein n=1 Tax=Amanita muscaria (strain Koide BX008) TaxID=946122 RepID=A0A0C2XLW7_AMAMK|nr:hypothetical protein M378DRAFT_625269 [Amanita muscaria Koide BX008]
MTIVRIYHLDHSLDCIRSNVCAPGTPSPRDILVCRHNHFDNHDLVPPQFASCESRSTLLEVRSYTMFMITMFQDTVSTSLFNLLLTPGLKSHTHVHSRPVELLILLLGMTRFMVCLSNTYCLCLVIHTHCFSPDTFTQKTFLLTPIQRTSVNSSFPTGFRDYAEAAGPDTSSLKIARLPHCWLLQRLTDNPRPPHLSCIWAFPISRQATLYITWTT